MTVRAFDTDREPWERQRGEGVRSYALFTEFLRVVPSERRLRNFAESQDVKLSQIQGMSARWRWGDRVGAYEADIERQSLKAVGDYNRKAASDLASIMTKVPEAARKALELGVRTIDEYMDSDPWQDEEGRWHGKLHAKDAVSLLAAANNLMVGLTRYLETAGQLTRSLNVNVSGRVEHALAAPEAAELMRFIGAMQEAGIVDEERRQILDAHIIEELGDPLALGRGDDNFFGDDGEPGEAVPVGREHQPLPMDADR